MTRFPGLSALCTILLMIFAFSAVTTVPVEAKSKRKGSVHSKKKKRRSHASRSSCSPAARAEGKRQALELVRTSSPDLCRMAGIDATATSGSPSEMAIAHNTSNTATAAMMQGALAGEEGEDLTELELEDDVQVDVDNFRSLWLSFVNTGNSDVTDAGLEKEKFLDVVMDWLGTRYDFGGMSRTGIDCSAFTRMVYSSVAKVELPRTAAMQYSVGMPIVKRTQLQLGDLVFFHTRKHAYVSHVGIYLGDNLFAHASSRYGVTISSLESTYYSKRLIGSRRLQDTDIQRLAAGEQPGNN